MSDVLEAPTQDAIAESLLGDQTSEQDVNQDHGTEEFTPDLGETEQQQVEAEGPETQLEEIADENWLPSEQQKVFPDDVLRQYAERRYPDILRLLDNDPTNGTLRQLLHDKLNTDIYLQQREQALEFDQQEFEQEPEATQQPTQPQITREQWFANLDRAIQERTDPEIAKAFHSDFLRAFGVPDAEIAKLPPGQAMQFTATASKYMLNLVSTFLPDMLQAQLGQQLAAAYPGFSDMYERSAYAMAWDRVRNSSPQFGTLPAFGTKEFSRTLHEAEAKFPELLEALLGPDGKIPIAQAGRAYTLLAKIATGQAVDSRLVQQAAQAGARNARRADVRRASANLGSGQSRAGSQRSSTASSRFQTNADLFDDEAMGRYEQEHGRL